MRRDVVAPYGEDGAALGDFHAPGDVPNGQVVVRGGASDVPPPGQVFSGSQGSTTADAATGVPHGQLRETTAGQIRSNGERLLFDCPFDETSDDYSDSFSVYAVPISTIDALPLDWRTLTSNGKDSIGTVRVTEVEFDITRRQQARVQKLGVLISAAEHISV